MEQSLKEIAKELKLIRKEFELYNDLLMHDMGLTEAPKQEKKEHEKKPNIAEQLNEMFKR